jgi:hypothetical protein
MKRVMDAERLSARQAEHRIRESDREVQMRVRKMLGVDVEDPQLYDAVLNTTSAPLDTLATVTIDLARAVAKSCSANSRHLLNDAYLTSQLRTALIAHPKIGRAPIEGTCSRGAVTITGESSVPPWVRDLVVVACGVGAKFEPVATPTTARNKRLTYQRFRLTA